MAARPNHKRRETGSEDVKKKGDQVKETGEHDKRDTEAGKKHKTMQSKDEFEVRQENMIYKTFDSKRES